MQWSPRHARCTLILFLLIFAAGQVKGYLARPVYPDPGAIPENWPPSGCLIDATALTGRALEVLPGGTTVADALTALGLQADPRGSGHCLPRAGILVTGRSGWRVRPMTQRERWVWRIPMNLNNCKPADLERISGIGPSLAKKIYRFVQGRSTLHSLSELNSVRGVGPGKLSVLKNELALN